MDADDVFDPKISMNISTRFFYDEQEAKLRASCLHMEMTDDYFKKSLEDSFD